MDGASVGTPVDERPAAGDGSGESAPWRGLGRIGD